MNTKRAQITAVLAFIIGAMAVFAGGRVLLGADPGYYVIDWLPVYNFALGVVTASSSFTLLQPQTMTNQNSTRII